MRKISLFLMCLLMVTNANAVSPYAIGIVRHLVGQNRMTAIPIQTIFSTNKFNVHKPSRPAPNVGDMTPGVAGGAVTRGDVITTRYVRDYLRQYADVPNLELNAARSDAIATEEYVLSAIDYVNGNNKLSPYARPNTLVDVSYMADVVQFVAPDTCPVPWTNIAPDYTTDIIPYYSRTYTLDDLTETPIADYGSAVVTYGGGRFVIVGNGAAAYSIDGKIWMHASVVPDISPSVVSYNNGMYVALGGNTVVYSTDGDVWDTNTLPMYANWSAITYGNGVFVAVTENSGQMLFSKDGINWDVNSVPVVNTSQQNGWLDVKFGNDVFVAVGRHDTGNYEFRYVIAHSSNGVEWTTQELGPKYAEWRAIAFGDGVFMITCSSEGAGVHGECYPVYSENGIDWTEYRGLDNYNRNGLVASTWILYTDDGFVAPEQMGAISCIHIFSVDSVEQNCWNPYQDKSEDWEVGTRKQGVAYGNGMWIVLKGNMVKTVDFGPFAQMSGHSWAVGKNCNGKPENTDGLNNVASMCDTFFVGGTAKCGCPYEISDFLTDDIEFEDAYDAYVDACSKHGLYDTLDQMCSCSVTQILSGGVIQRVEQRVPVWVDYDFKSWKECAWDCANVCADNAVNNTDGVQKDILCGD